MRYTLITRIYFVEVASLLIYYAFGVIPLPVTVPLTIEALSLEVWVQPWVPSSERQQVCHS